MKIAYINSVCVAHDAISTAVRDEIQWVQEAGHEVRLFAYACDHGDLPFTRVEREADVIFDPFFQSCDLVVFHFGVYYPLFNLLPAVPRQAKRVVVFHNITPKEFLPQASHELIDRSFAQMANIVFAEHVICDSETNQEVLNRSGIRTPSTVIPLAVHTELRSPPRKPSFDDGVVRIAFVGRFVKSKGPGDLLAAVSSVMGEDADLRIRLDLVGNLNFSDEMIVAEVQSRMRAMLNRYGARLQVNIHANAPESEKQRILSEADLFVLPTRHEGFCVPILEALASGCCVVAYDNSNTPAISGGLANLVPTGDVGRLASAIADTLTLTRTSSWKSGGYPKFLEAAMAHTRKFNPEAVRQGYLDFIERMLSKD
jgi:glycosyltransferase involved in cell wall biosynthesis